MTITDWRDVRPGTVLTVKPLAGKRSFKIRVKWVDGNGTGYAWVIGERLRMDGKPSRLASSLLHGPGFREELVNMGDVTAQEWDLEQLQADARDEYSSRRKLNADGRRARGTSNGNSRGGSRERRVRKAWLLREFGDGVKAPCSFCTEPVTMETISVDRWPIPGCDGGTYARGNIRPACRTCNSSHGATVRRSA